MANVTFILKDSKKETSLIFVRFSFNYYEIDVNGKKVFKQLKYSTGETINPKYWDIKKQRSKETKEFPQHPEFNQRLNDIETIIKDVYRKMLNDSEVITPETLKEKLNEYFIKNNKVVNPPKQQNIFTSFIQTIIDETKRGERTTNKGMLFQNRTVLSYSNTKNKLIQYETDSNNKKQLKFSDINISFYNKFIKYLNKKEFAVNSIGGHIKNIKVMMNIATERGLNDVMDFNKKGFTTIEEETQSIYLTIDELQKISNLDLSDNKKLDHVRDMFLIGCFTGLRFSDLKQLRKEHFHDNIIKIETIKTGKQVVIPLHTIVREIFNKYEYNLPRLISNQKMNEYLKELGELAIINETIFVTETRGGVKFKKSKPKYKLITVHTARRSFATNTFLQGLPVISIKMITGHKTERAFLKYIKINEEENAQKMLEHPFFNQSNNLKVVS